MSEENILPLKTLQHWMQMVLINPQEGIHPTQILPEELQDNIEKIVNPSSRLSGRQRLAIYQRGYIARLRDCMEGQFRALQHALGPELFQAFADEYLRQYPSVSYTLSYLGRSFAAFLEETRPDKDAGQREDWPDFMIELAQLEYALMLIFDSEEPANIIYADANTPDENLQLVPNFWLYKFRFPVNHYFQAVQKGENPELPFEKESYLAVTRKNYQIGMFNLNPLQYRFLELLKTKPQPIPQALKVFSQNHNLPLSDLQTLWKIWKEKWLELGFFIIK